MCLIHAIRTCIIKHADSLNKLFLFYASLSTQYLSVFVMCLFQESFVGSFVKIVIIFYIDQMIVDIYLTWFVCLIYCDFGLVEPLLDTTFSNYVIVVDCGLGHNWNMILMFEMNVNQKLNDFFKSNFILYTIVSSILKWHNVSQNA